MAQSHTADQPTKPEGKVTKDQQPHDAIKTTRSLFLSEMIAKQERTSRCVREMQYTFKSNKHQWTLTIKELRGLIVIANV